MEKILKEVNLLVEWLKKKDGLNYSAIDFMNNKNKIQDRVDWHYIGRFFRLSGGFIEKFDHRLGKDDILNNQKLSETFMEKYKDCFNWHTISIAQRLSETFIEKFQDRLNWDMISMYQTHLSEAFIEKFQHKVHWGYILKYQNVSEAFVEKMDGDRRVKHSSILLEKRT